jgi:hypothetical protein
LRIVAENVDALRGRERAKRLLVLGAIATLYAAGWLLVAWHASRIGQAECTLVEVPNTSYCTVEHRQGGERYTLPWGSCDRSTRWPRVPIGSKLPCFYYRSSPDDIFFEPRRIVWLTSGRLIFLAGSVGLLCSGIVWWLRRGRVAAPRPAHPHDAPYRTAPPSGSDADHATHEPLAIPMAQAYWLRWVVAGPFLALGGLLEVLLDVLAWWASGEVGVDVVILHAVATTVVTVGALGVFYRSGLVVDGERGVVYSWWGLFGRSWFRTYDALAALTRASVHASTGPRGGTFYYLDLELDEGIRRSYDMSAAEAERAAGLVNAYLAAESAASRAS